MINKSFYDTADKILLRYEKNPASLIPVMLDVQEELSYLPGEILAYVAEHLVVTKAKAYSVATFYEHFSLTSRENT